MLLNLVYYNCPMLCNLLLNGQVEALRKIPWTPGDKYEVVTVSINPDETFDLAAAKKRMYLAGFDNNRAAFAAHWHFLADYADNAKKLADQIGFHYRWDPRYRSLCPYRRDHVPIVLGKDLPLPLRHQTQAAGYAAGVYRSE